MCLGIPGQLVEVVSDELRLATIEVSGVRRCVSMAMLDEKDVAIGDWVLLHVGFAVARIDEEEAARTLAYLQEMGQAYADELDSFESSAIR